MSEYFDALTDAMSSLAEDPRTVFIGQAVECPGTGMFNTLKGVPMERRIELPVAEDMQMGMAIGMSLAGLLPVCIYPRFNFLLLAVNQLVLHLDKLPTYSGGAYVPKVIIRTAIATDDPLDPGPQHLGDFTDAIYMMLNTVSIFRMETPQDVTDYYKRATTRTCSTILVEQACKY